VISSCIEAITDREQLTRESDYARLLAIQSLSNKEFVGQVLTPAFVANLMACLFDSYKAEERILDPGIGTASLSSAICRSLIRNKVDTSITLDGFDIDAKMAAAANGVLSSYGPILSESGVHLDHNICNQDFIKYTCTELATAFDSNSPKKYDKIIMNPPYGKIKSTSKERKRLREVGIESVNYYAAFLALGFRLLKDGGELVSITPRSFCNGPYYQPLREDIVQMLSIESICLFESRKSAFKEQNVLQETVIFHFKKKPQSERVQIITIDGANHDKLKEHIVSAEKVIGPGPNRFIHLTTSKEEERLAALMNRLPCTLEALGIQVSTGRVVDFRTKENLRHEMDDESIPLIYARHLGLGTFSWPSPKVKANAIQVNAETLKMMDPAGTYVGVKRFSSKEEKKRIVAAALNLADLNDRFVAFDNKTNYFHCDRTPIPQDLANGLAAYLNSSVVDRYFRIFNGHTQVNATDLRALRYPDKEALESLGRQIGNPMDQDEIDLAVDRAFFSTSRCEIAG
jgi:adenine-specific DNA-methyltransferase